MSLNRSKWSGPSTRSHQPEADIEHPCTRCGGPEPSSRHSQSGFTLLEIMLTVGLIALTATFVGLNIGQSDAKLADLEAKRFVALLNLAIDESIVTGRPIRLTMDAAAHSYQFTALELPAVFSVDDTEDENQERPGAEDPGPPQASDSFFKQRTMPEVVKIDFSLLAGVSEKEEKVGFVSARIHEMFQKNLFDEEDEILDKAPSEDSILIEPNGLVSPFSLSLSVAERVSKVGLDQYGRVVLLTEQ